MGSVAETETSQKQTHPLDYAQQKSHTNNIIEFHCTGFSKFFKVPINPSELLMQELQKLVDNEKMYSHSHSTIVLASTTVLKTDARKSALRLKELYRDRHKCGESERNDNNATSGEEGIERRRACRKVFLHCGVDVGSPRFRLELQCVNEATFTCPDEGGWSPCKRCIEPNNDISRKRTTALPISDIANRLRRRGFDTEVSYDAGRFVCNWVYYNSLKLAAETEDCTALFLHVPDLKTLPLQHQVAFVRALLQEIAELPSLQPKNLSTAPNSAALPALQGALV